MPPHWLETARMLHEAGATYREIGQAVNRSHARVGQVLNAHIYHRPPDRKANIQSTLTKRRRLIRRKCRRIAARTGEDVEALYARYKVTSIDRSRAWDELK